MTWLGLVLVMVVIIWALGNLERSFLAPLVGLFGVILMWIGTGLVIRFESLTGPNAWALCSMTILSTLGVGYIASKRKRH